jgi:hypothetical protein
MPRYFLNLRTPSDELLDLEGVSMAEDAVTGAALAAARDCMAHDVRTGRLNLKYRIEVQDEAGEIVHTLRFSEAVSVSLE